jgi:hypothetical protein
MRDIVTKRALKKLDRRFGLDDLSNGGTSKSAIRESVQLEIDTR